MKCDEAKTKAAARALDELEGDERGALESHLEACAACRAAAELERRTVAGLHSLNRADESEIRRERTVAAMVAARGPAVTRRRWVAMSVAAAALAALAVPFLLPRGGLVVERLDGTAWIERAGGGRVEVRLGDRLRSGDRLGTQGVVTLAGGSGLKVLVHRDSEVAYDHASEPEKLRLDRGAMRVDASPEKPVAILDALGRRALVSGTCDARYRKVAGYPQDPKAMKSEFLIHVKKGAVRFEGTGGARSLESGQTLTVSEEGTVNVEVGEPGRSQP